MPNRRASQHEIPRRSRIRRTAGRLLLGGTLALVLLLVLARLALPLVPLPDGLDSPARTHPPVQLLDRNGQSLRLIPDPVVGLARPLAEADIPPSIVLATLAAEDARFYRHPGFDPLATTRALGQWIRHRRVISGASTLTQQLVKLGHPRPRNLRTKLIELVLAARLELDWDKDRILRAYLARIDYGNRNTGLASAAQHYFGKHPRSLTLAESAFLAGIPQAPTRLNPRLRFQRTKARQEWILNRCHALGWVDEATLARALAEPIRILPAAPVSRAPHFVEFTLARLPPTIPANPAPPIRTTLDPGLQEVCERAIQDQLDRLAHHNAHEAAVVIIHNPTGEILAMVGSPDWSEPNRGQVNGTLARRSPGSALKPFTYLLAFLDGAHAGTIVPDIPTRFQTATGLFEPANYDRHFSGPVTLRRALAASLNIPAVRTLEAHGGPPRLLQLLRQLGLQTLDRPADHYGLGLTLGDGEVRLLDLANAYATVARRGLFLPPTTRPGDLAAPIRLLPADECWLLADILSDPLARAATFGVLSPLQTPYPLACKTGTSSAFRDNWAIGFTPEFTTGVWVGNFDGSPMINVSGIDGAGPILRTIFDHLHAARGTSPFTPPADVLRAEVHPLTGRAPHLPGTGVLESFLHGSRPEPADPQALAPDGALRLPPTYAGWLGSPDNRLGRSVALAESTTRPVPAFTILSPLPGTVFLHDPDVPDADQNLRLQASEPCRWSSPSLLLDGRGPATLARLVPGHHRLTAYPLRGGPGTETWIEVRRR